MRLASQYLAQCHGWRALVFRANASHCRGEIADSLRDLRAAQSTYRKLKGVPHATIARQVAEFSEELSRSSQPAAELPVPGVYDLHPRDPSPRPRRERMYQPPVTTVEPQPDSLRWQAGADVPATSRTAIERMALQRRPVLPPGESEIDRFEQSLRRVSVRWTRLDNGGYEGLIERGEN